MDALYPAVFVRPTFLYIECRDRPEIHRCGVVMYAHDRIHFEKGDMLYVRKTYQEQALLLVIDHIVGYEGRAVSNPWIDESYVKLGSPLELLADAAE